jgi:hypothetical protein
MGLHSTRPNENCISSNSNDVTHIWKININVATIVQPRNPVENKVLLEKIQFDNGATNKYESLLK